MNALSQAFSYEWQLGQAARRAGDFDRAFHHLERAHILGQRRTWLHVKSHIGMLQVGWHQFNFREVFGQLVRIAAAAVFSRIWVPVGNTGRANVSATKPMDVPPDLRAFLNELGE